MVSDPFLRSLRLRSRRQGMSGALWSGAVMLAMSGTFAEEP